MVIFHVCGEGFSVLNFHVCDYRLVSVLLLDITLVLLGFSKNLYFRYVFIFCSYSVSSFSRNQNFHLSSVGFYLCPFFRVSLVQHVLYSSHSYNMLHGHRLYHLFNKFRIFLIVSIVTSGLI